MSRTNYAKRGPAARFGDWLRQLRREEQLTLREVAARVEMDQAILSKIELGQRVPTPEQTRHLAKFFRVEEREMQAHLIAEKFRQEHREDRPTARQAIYILAEAAETGGPWGRRGRGRD